MILRLRDVAKDFGTTVQGLAEMMGVTRQTLYNYFDKAYEHATAMPMFIKALRYVSIEILENEIELAKKRKEARDAFLDKLERLHKAGGVDYGGSEVDPACNWSS